MATVTMIQCIETEKKNMKLGEVKELCLNGCSATEIEGLTDEFSALEKLTMANVGLTTLAGMPMLQNLTKLDVSGNPIETGLEAVAKCTGLVMLNLSGNKLKTVTDLSPLASLESLTHLELNNCEIASLDNYRKEVFAALPHLKYLDGLDQNGQEEDNANADEAVADGTNGATNGHTEEAGDEKDEEEDDDEEEEEEIGLSALRGDKELEDDEEDYVPGEEDADDDADEPSDDEADAVEEDVDEDEIANLSAAGVTGPRRAVKRAAEDAQKPEEATSAKCPAPDATGDAANDTEKNGADA